MNEDANAARLEEIKQVLLDGNSKFDKIEQRIDKMEQRVDLYYRKGTGICKINEIAVKNSQDDIEEVKQTVKEITTSIRNHVYIAATIIGILYVVLSIWKG